MKQIRTNILNPVSAQETELLQDCVISFDAGRICAIEPFDAAIHTNYSDKLQCICLPGLIDLHTHLSQYHIRGLYRPALLPWLNEIVFPEEHKSTEQSYATSLAATFFRALLQAGTTTAVIYTAPFQIACETAFLAAGAAGFRAIIGMTLMDRNSPAELLQTTDYAYQSSVELYYKWHNSSPLLDYIFTPRFAPTCSAELMTKIGRFTNDRNARIQTHLSENMDEIKWVDELFGARSYTEVYHKYGILGANTILAHAIHLSDSEFQLLSNTNTKIAHCPDSNFYLKSGEFPLRRMIDSGIQFGLGSDVGAGTSLSMLYHAKIANFRQTAYPVPPEMALYSISLGAAKVLNLQDSIGSLSPGKQADMIFLPLNDEDQAHPENILSRLVFFGYEYPVQNVFIAGEERGIPHR